MSWPKTGTTYYHAQLGLPEKGRQSVCYLMNSTYPTTHLTKANNIHVVVLCVLNLDKFYTKYIETITGYSKVLEYYSLPFKV